jgi:serine/threonine protein kinase
MSLDGGPRLGVHEVIVRLGIGGMGEIYRARDVKLGRDVVIKICRTPSRTILNASRGSNGKRRHSPRSITRISLIALAFT